MRNSEQCDFLWNLQFNEFFPIDRLGLLSNLEFILVPNGSDVLLLSIGRELGMPDGLFAQCNPMVVPWIQVLTGVSVVMG